MHTSHAERVWQARMPRINALALAKQKPVKTPMRRTCATCEQVTDKRLQTGHMMALAAAIAPLLVPLQALSAEQISVADAGVASPEVIRYNNEALTHLLHSIHHNLPSAGLLQSQFQPLRLAQPL